LRGLALIFLGMVVSCSPKLSDPNLLCRAQVQLGDPEITIDSMFFYKEALVTMDFRQEGSSIYYEIDDKGMQQYTDPLTITNSCKIRSYVSDPNYKNSDTLYHSITKLNRLLHSNAVTLKLIPEPHENYPGLGSQTLTDHVKGSLDFRSGNRWCGFDDHQVRIDLQFSEPTELSSLHLSILSDEKSWIFAPHKISATINNADIHQLECEPTAEGDQSQLKTLILSWKKLAVSSIQVTIENLKEIPDWHAGAGSQPWLFIDEIIVE